MRTADKKAADADDRILENAEHLARHARTVELILKGKPVEWNAAPAPAEEPAAPLTVVRT
ncbi:hypothetical protein [Thiocapsa imhoffii]|uniref:hypothetical protein n=1 Tax=Thiocapsa imhoffii TaxID=382777 RepID=UPI001F5BF05E|nr:hypothetical protein [Thiocapsa imhoffii]